jgi:Flp pilus assembly protein TadG
MNRCKQRGVSLMVGIVSLLFLIPLMGLSIDVGFIYAVDSRLQAAMDGSTLAAARALSIGETTTAQQTSAQSNAVNWFYANFPSSYFGTHNTVYDVNQGGSGQDAAGNGVYDDPNNPHLQHVTATATTVVDTFFMRWFGVNNISVSAKSDATRRDVVVMMVLDRSGSMNTSSACPDLIAAAKLFTGQFAAGRDYIGAVSFSDGSYLHSAPTTDFQTVLGYTNDSGHASGQLDNIVCNGGTGTPQALAIAYDQLYKLNLTGALNVILLETDGLPNTLTLNWWDSANSVAGIASASGCKDASTSRKTKNNGGFGSSSVLPAWDNSGHTMSSSYYSNVPAGIVGALYSGDPAQEAFSSEYFIAMFDPWQSNYTTSNNSTYEDSSTTSNATSGCAFNSGGVENNISDFAWAPLTDVYGNQLNPSTNPFAGSVTTVTSGSGTYLSLAGSNSTVWTNYHKAVLNATDNAAYQMRTNSTIPAYFFVIGLGGNCSPSCTSSPRTGDPPDNILLQRIANDPNGDLYNNPPTYSACSEESTCVHYSTQPVGTYIYSSSKTELTQAFLTISSQVLRLSH